jgi:DNA-binding PadR family transcriptional regulator
LEITKMVNEENRTRSLSELNDQRDLRMLGLILNSGGSMRTSDITDKEKELGMSHQTIMNHLYFLEREGWLINEKTIEGKRLSSIWRLTDKALEALGAIFENAPGDPFQALERQLSDPSIKTEDKMRLLERLFHDSQLQLGACAIASVRNAIIKESYPRALEIWRSFFTLLVEQQTLSLLLLLHKHRKLVLKALPSVKEQAQKLGILSKKGEKNV